MLRERVAGSEFEAFFEVVLLAGLGWEVAAVSVLVGFEEGLFGQLHFFMFWEREEIGG